MIIVGGTYSEMCLEPFWDNIYGSGLRAVSVVLENDKNLNVDYYTCADSEISQYLDVISCNHSGLTVHKTSVEKSPEFHYDHPMKVPMIVPRPDFYSDKLGNIEVEGGDVLLFGLLEATTQVRGGKVVFDPQSPANPKPFSVSGSSANQLAYVINISEARKISNKESIDDIKQYFFDKEKCFCLILKMGAKGALLFKDDASSSRIPIYITNKVWPIGSGDVFSSYFALNWFNGTDVEESARLASCATAHYCNSKSLELNNKVNNVHLEALTIKDTPKGKVYLAGPFFNYTERWLINEVWRLLKGVGLEVFSPFHDVGHGKAKDVVSKDIIGLNASEIVFAVVDGLDSGTLFEIGYAVSKNKKVIAYTQKESEEALKMLEGTNCIIESDFTTAIYKLYWELAKK